MKKVFGVSLFFIIVFVFNFVPVYAAVNTTNSDIECIYANGIVVGTTYNSTSGKTTVYVKDYPVSKSVNIDSDTTIANVSIHSVSNATGELSDFTCPTSIYYWIAYSPTGEEQLSYRGVYNFNSINVTNELIDARKFWFITISKKNGVVPVRFKESGVGTPSDCSDNYEIQSDSTVSWVQDLDDGTFCTPEAQIPLVGERIYFNDDIGDDAYWHTFKSYTPKDEAVGTTQYAQFYKTDAPSGGVSTYLLQIGKTVTSIKPSAEFLNYVSGDKDFYVCLEASTTISDSSRGDSSYKFSSINHKITKITETESDTCPAGSIKYKRTTEVCKITTFDEQESFCDKYPKVSEVLKTIIVVIQIIIPIMLIVLTALEIAKIVVAGNLDEELPKRKKSIIVRFIIMLSFFFLPLIVRLILGIVDNVSDDIAILDIGCLFGYDEHENIELTEKNCVDSGT